MRPTFSVIMPTYNTPEDYLHTAITSIMKQSFTDFELIIIDDGSSNEDYRLCEKYATDDERIKVFVNEKNLGVAGTLNRALTLAKGKYIARMDSDDISHKDRLKITYEFLEENPDVDIVGTWRINFANGRGKKTSYTENFDLRANLFFSSPFTHPTIVFRATSVEKYALQYDENIKAEDYDLWFRAAKFPNLKFAVIDKYLLKYRIHEKQVTQRDNKIQVSTDLIVAKVLDYINCELSDEDLALYMDFTYTRRELNKLEFSKVAELYARLLDSKTSKLCEKQEAVDKVVEERFIKSCIWHFKKYGHFSGDALKEVRNKTAAKVDAKWAWLIRILGIFNRA